MIEITGLTKRFPATSASGEVVALDGLDLTVERNEFLTVLGPSGCGKTTLLRCIAGLETYEEGEIKVDGSPVTGPGPDRAMVFQSFALLPWAKVLDNVAFGLEMAKVPRAEREERARELIELVGLEGFEDRIPRELSGGMQQRVGLARALAVEPSVLLMDEPFSALDEQTRRLLQEELTRIWEQAQLTVVFITHSMEESVLMGDRVVLLSPRPGKVHRMSEVPIGRPRPRDVERSPEFHRITADLWDELREMHQEKRTSTTTSSGAEQS